VFKLPAVLSVKSLFLVGAIAYCTSAFGATITSSVSCEVRRQPDDFVLYQATNTSECSESFFSSTAAQASASGGETANTASYSLATRALAVGLSYPRNDGSGIFDSSFASANASVGIALPLATLGDSRFGLLRYDFDFTMTQGEGSVSWNSQYLSGGCTWMGQTSCQATGEVEIPLGVPIDFFVSSLALGFGDTATTVMSDINGSFSLSFFELDGVTPVILSSGDPGGDPVVPEPSSAMLASSAVALLALVAKLRR
jgi:hypothetical protein